MPDACFIDRHLLSPLQERDKKDAELRLLERSVFSDRMVFVKAVHESNYMSDLELSVYNSWLVSLLSLTVSHIVAWQALHATGNFAANTCCYSAKRVLN